MIVVDASVIVDLLLGGPSAQNIVQRLSNEELAAPDLIDAEVPQVLRKLELLKKLSSLSVSGAFRDYQDLPIFRFPMAAIAKRAFALRKNLTIYDAMYVVLAERLEVPLLTRDARLARALSRKSVIEHI